MILKGRSEVTAYRMHVPKWAVAPTSGTGAGRHGGRANRIGLNALYLALDVNTAVREYQQVSPLMPPGTFVSYRLTIDPVVDFTNGYQSGLWSGMWEDF
jgi:RES domain-containing protein